MHFPEVSRSGDIVLRVENIRKGYAHTLFSDLSFDVLRGERWGIIGANGTGKTTLLNCCLAREPLQAGRVILGTGVKVAYFDQSMRALPEDALVVDAVRPDHREFDEPARRDLLARFGITGDMVFERVASLSGGERSRVALARLAAQEANLLMLDEPTNHLDLWARDAIERAISQFPGTVILVSHDRFLLNRVVDHLLVFEAGGISIVDGNYETYLNLQESRGAVGPASQSPAHDPARLTKQPPGTGPPAAAKKRKFPYRKVSEIEQDIDRQEREIAQLHTLLASPEVLRDGNRVKQAMEKLEQSQTALDQLLEHWEEAVERSG
jgi:ATP-binding cassette subfamily F protein 3